MRERWYHRYLAEGFCFLVWLLLWEYVFGLGIKSNLLGAIAGLILIRVIFNWYYARKYYPNYYFDRDE